MEWFLLVFDESGHIQFIGKTKDGSFSKQDGIVLQKKIRITITLLITICYNTDLNTYHDNKIYRIQFHL